MKQFASASSGKSARKRQRKKKSGSFQVLKTRWHHTSHHRLPGLVFPWRSSLEGQLRVIDADAHATLMLHIGGFCVLPASSGVAWAKKRQQPGHQLRIPIKPLKKKWHQLRIPIKPFKKNGQQLRIPIKPLNEQDGIDHRVGASEREKNDTRHVTPPQRSGWKNQPERCDHRRKKKIPGVFWIINSTLFLEYPPPPPLV